MAKQAQALELDTLVIEFPTLALTPWLWTNYFSWALASSSEKWKLQCLIKSLLGVLTEAAYIHLHTYICIFLHGYGIKAFWKDMQATGHSGCLLTVGTVWRQG